MDISTFNDPNLNYLWDKLSKETNETIFLYGDFNTGLPNFDTSEHLGTFLDDLASNLIQLHIFLPTRMCNDIKTLIDNIFWSLLKKAPRVSRVLKCPSAWMAKRFEYPSSSVSIQVPEYPWGALGVPLECLWSALRVRKCPLRTAQAVFEWPSVLSVLFE